MLAAVAITLIPSRSLNLSFILPSLHLHNLLHLFHSTPFSMAPTTTAEEDNPPTTSFPQSLSDLDLSFTSSSASTSSFTFNGAPSSARSSLSLTLPSSSLKPHPHCRLSHHWSALRAASNLTPDSSLHLRHLKLLRHIGSGNLARVFHCRLRAFDHLDFALKVIDLDASVTALSHVRAESRVLASLDHPFLPTLYARLDASHYACFLIDYCPNGDLHSLLRHRPNHHLPLSAVKFYAAEVLLALEYLHVLGFVYRDLKPENVLLRADGHVMLSDFDLCFHSDVSPVLYRGKGKEEFEFVAEPESAFSCACVGTHEYLPPEIVSGAGHGNGVDWWAFGVFIYELMYGRTPFKGGSKEATLKNILSRELRFPDCEADQRRAAVAARDLIARLLEKDPRRRMGGVKGATEIKRHPFFDGVSWALIRMMKPPAVAGSAGNGGRRKVSREGKRWWSTLKWSSCNSK